MAERSTCKRAKHGCVIVRDNQILVTGYNGSIPGEPHCTEVGCLIERSAWQHQRGDFLPHCKRTLHAEENAFMQAAKLGIPIEGAVLYVTGQPCFDDCKRIIRAGISEVRVMGDHPWSDPMEPVKQGLYMTAGIKYTHVVLG
jgi:dCMP deaminase